MWLSLHCTNSDDDNAMYTQHSYTIDFMLNNTRQAKWNEFERKTTTIHAHIRTHKQEYRIWEYYCYCCLILTNIIIYNMISYEKLNAICFFSLHVRTLRSHLDIYSREWKERRKKEKKNGEELPSFLRLGLSLK